MLVLQSQSGAASRTHLCRTRLRGPGCALKPGAERLFAAALRMDSRGVPQDSSAQFQLRELRIQEKLRRPVGIFVSEVLAPHRKRSFHPAADAVRTLQADGPSHVLV